MTEQERAAASAEHYKRMRAELDRRLSLDPELRQLSKKIQNGSADFQDTFRYSEIVSNHIGRIMQENVGTITNPLGKQYVCEALLKDHYNAINDVLGEVQVQIDEKLDIHLNPVKPPCPIERIVQVAHALEDPTVKPEVIQRRAKAPVVNVSMSFHDDYIKENAKIRAKLGLKPTITRYGSGCCKWCSEVAGRYRFGDQPKDVFRRHDNCKCTIIYDTQVLRGHQNEDGGRSKKWEEVDPKSVEKLGFTPTVHMQEQAAALQERLMQGIKMPAGTIPPLKATDPSSSEYLNTAKPSFHSKDELRSLAQYAKDRGIRLYGINRFDGDAELLKGQIDAIADMRTEYKLDGKLTVCFRDMQGDDLGETKSAGDVIYLNKKAYRDRSVTDAYLNADQYLSSSSVSGIGIHEMGHVISLKYGEKGIDIARKTYYNIYKEEITNKELLKYLKNNVSSYSIFLPDQYINKPFNAKRFKEIVPEILAKDKTNPDDFTSEFVKLLKEAYDL